jgi:hypothetical protein
MDRRNVTHAFAKLTITSAVLVAGSSGCRSTRSEVPPGKPYQTIGNPPTVGFSSDPHQNAAQGMAGLYGNRGPGGLVPDGKGSTGQTGDIVLGTPTQGSSGLGLPSDHRYSAPGTSGSGGDTSLGDSLLKTIPSANQIVEKDLKASPPSDVPAGYP